MEIDGDQTLSLTPVPPLPHMLLTLFLSQNATPTPGVVFITIQSLGIIQPEFGSALTDAQH